MKRLTAITLAIVLMPILIAAANQTPPAQSAQQPKQRSVRTVEVRGIVKEILDSPASEAKVVAIHESTGARRFTTTNERGEFSLTLEGLADESINWWVMAVKDEGCGTFNKPIVIEPLKAHEVPTDSIRDDIEISLAHGAKISGTVRHATTGLPIGLAKVYSLQGQQVRTNTAGEFVLHGVPRGVTVLLAISPGKVRTRVYVDVTVRESAEVDISMEPAGVLKGHVLDRQKQPIGGVTISPPGGSRFLNPAITEPSDSEGHYEYEGLPLNRLIVPMRIYGRDIENDTSRMFAINPNQPVKQMDLHVKPVEYLPAPAMMLAPVLGRNALPPPAAIRGRVVDPDGKPVRTFKVVLLPILQNDQQDSGSYSSPVRHFSDDRGQFVIGKLDLDKRYRVSVEAAGFGRAIVEPLFARSGQIEQLTDAEFRLTRPHPLKVRTVDADSKQPLPDVMVGFTDHRQMHDQFEWNYSLGGAFVDWTTTSGDVSHPNLAWEQLTLFVEHPGYARQHVAWKDKLDRSQTSEPDLVEIALWKEARLRLKITKFDTHHPLGLHAKIVSATNDEIYTELATDEKSPELTMNQLPPGRTSIEILDARGREPWVVVTKLDVELKPGDNLLEVELNEIKK